MSPPKSTQEVFDRVCAHLRQQRQRSMSATGLACAYRGTHERKCAVGCLISDEDYSPSMENHGPATIMNNPGLEWMKDFLCILSRLQAIHDCTPIDRWNFAMALVVQDFSLTPSMNGYV